MSKTITVSNSFSWANVMPQVIATFYKKGGTNLPNIIAAQNQLIIDKNNLKKYKSFCNFEKNDWVPITYIYILSVPLQMKLLAQPQVPFPLPGLVHFSNTIEQFSTIHCEEKLNLKTSFGNLIAHEKGQAFEVNIDVFIETELVCKITSTYLYKGKTGIGIVVEKQQHDLPSNCIKQSWNFDTNDGFRYAQISGDFNPIHLNSFTSKLLGMKNHIMHGMYSKAKILATLEKQILSENFKINVDFKLPIELPNIVVFRYHKTENRYDFDVVDKTQTKPHLKGSILY